MPDTLQTGLPRLQGVFQAFFISCTIDNTAYPCYVLQYGKTHEKK